MSVSPAGNASFINLDNPFGLGQSSLDTLDGLFDANQSFLNGVLSSVDTKASEKPLASKDVVDKTQSVPDSSTREIEPNSTSGFYLFSPLFFSRVKEDVIMSKPGQQGCSRGTSYTFGVSSSSDVEVFGRSSINPAPVSKESSVKPRKKRVVRSEFAKAVRYVRNSTSLNESEEKFWVYVKQRMNYTKSVLELKKEWAVEAQNHIKKQSRIKFTIKPSSQ